MDKHSESKHTVVGRPSSDLVESLVMLNRKSVMAGNRRRVHPGQETL